MKIKKIRHFLHQKQIDFFILPNSDEFANEYIPESEKRVQFISNFSGSNAVILFTKKGKNLFFTDGRYLSQAKQELDLNIFEIFDLGKISWYNFLQEKCQGHEIIAFDQKLHSISQIKQLEKHFNIKPTENPIDEIWQNDSNNSRSSSLRSKIFPHKIQYSGVAWQNKLQQIQSKLQQNQAIILNCPTSIAWLFNIRASDIAHTPVALGYSIILKNQAKLFFDKSRIDTKTSQHLENIEVISPNNFYNEIQKLPHLEFSLDYNQCNYSIFNLLSENKIKNQHLKNPCIAQKSIKNKIEIEGMIKCHIEDGAALTKFLFWLENNKQNNLDEISVAHKLLEFRQQGRNFVDQSFPTISAFGPNGAVIHYKPTIKTNKKFAKNGLFLVDSGGQYFEGTTDVTRVIVIGESTQEQKRNFTLVLKGHIRIAQAKFPKGTTGHALDVLARYNLWQDGKDYKHGTGHGVGSFLSVHEGPQSISSRHNPTKIEAGMILSNEPGFYIDGDYGIRIENLLLVEEFNKDFLQFKTLTLAPIDFNLIDFALLTKKEKAWLANYHQEIFDKLKFALDDDEKNWLRTFINN